MRGVIFITATSYFVSLETASTRKSEVFVSRISSGNVNASVIMTCQYPQIYLKILKEKLRFLCFFVLLPTGLVNMTFCYHAA